MSKNVRPFFNLISESCEWNAEETDKKIHHEQHWWQGEPVCVRNNYMEARCKVFSFIQMKRKSLLLWLGFRIFPSGRKFSFVKFLRGCLDDVQILWISVWLKSWAMRDFMEHILCLKSWLIIFFLAWKPLF